ncbi:hypothetical protein [Sporolactobacillus terrae]|uniref:hypothetical protein n=1 Tax=Sporolactobacillus terrae TaxID=269673 RepID=UPI00048FD2CE|nr:hypothetical protein [Sporolactobacillus terrae]
MRWPYPNIGVLTTRAFRNLLNKIFGDIGADMQEQKSRVDNLITSNPQPSEIQDMRTGRDGQTYPVARDMVLGEIAKTEAAQAEINQDTAAQLADIKNVMYEDFGAKGDGVTDDYQAILAAHLYANEHDLPIKGRSNANYYIKDAPASIPIKTLVDWNEAQFIIDDTELTGSTTNTHIFIILPSNDPIDVSEQITSLASNTTYIPALAVYGDVLLHVINSNKKQFIRTAPNVDGGYNQQEVIRVCNGNVLSHINWDYEIVTSAMIYKNDKNKLRVGGGHFNTLVNKLENVYGNGVDRGIYIRRSNTILSISHNINGESSTQTSKPYNGWISAMYCCDLVLRDTTLSAHRIFYDENNIPMGSYDLALHLCTDILLENVGQFNGIMDSSLWGVMASNYTKDVKLVNCKINRYDAHRGVHNLTIDNSIIGYQGINIIGSGLLQLRRTKVNCNQLINLRADYGSTWDGVIKIRNCELIPTDLTQTDIKIVFFVNREDHDYGYRCYFPNLDIDGILIHTNVSSKPTIISNKVLNTGYPIISGLCKDDYLAENEAGRYPLIFKDYVKVRNVKVTTPCPFSIFYNHPAYCYCDNVNVINTHSTYSDSSVSEPFLDIKPNFLIVIDNCDLWDAKDETSNSGGLINSGATDITHSFIFNNHRMCPNIIINDLTMSLNMGLYPMLVTGNRCTIQRCVRYA